MLLIRLMTQWKHFSAVCSGGQTLVFLAIPGWVGNGPCVTRGGSSGPQGAQLPFTASKLVSNGPSELF